MPIIVIVVTLFGMFVVMLNYVFKKCNKLLS